MLGSPVWDTGLGEWPRHYCSRFGSIHPGEVVGFLFPLDILWDGSHLIGTEGRHHRWKGADNLDHQLQDWRHHLARCGAGQDRKSWRVSLLLWRRIQDRALDSQAEARGWQIHPSGEVTPSLGRGDDVLSAHGTGQSQGCYLRFGHTAWWFQSARCKNYVLEALSLSLPSRSPPCRRHSFTRLEGDVQAHALRIPSVEGQVPSIPIAYYQQEAQIGRQPIHRGAWRWWCYAKRLGKLHGQAADTTASLCHGRNRSYPWRDRGSGDPRYVGLWFLPGRGSPVGRSHGILLQGQTHLQPTPIVEEAGMGTASWYGRAIRVGCTFPGITGQPGRYHQGSYGSTRRPLGCPFMGPTRSDTASGRRWFSAATPKVQQS